MLKNTLTGEEIPVEAIKSLADLAQHQIAIEQAIEKQSASLDVLKEQLKLISESTIPEAMMSIGMEEFTLASGEKVSVKKYYSASIPGEFLPQALDWLRNSGNGDIIKNSVVCQFGKGEDDIANLLAEELRKKGLHPEQKTFVHPMTLKSFVKERIENAQELPQELFGVFVGNKTKITPAK
jgi:hypothetical protein